MEWCAVALHKRAFFFTVCIARSRSKASQEGTNYGSQHVLRTPWNLDAASRRRKWFYTQHVHCTPCAIPKTRHQQRRKGQDQGPGQRPGNKDRAGTREPKGHPGPGTTDRWQPTGPMGLHATSITIQGHPPVQHSTLRATLQKHNKATHPCNIAR